MVLGMRDFSHLARAFYEGEKRGKRKRRKEIQVWKVILVGWEHLLCLELVWNCLELMYGNPSLSKLGRKNPIRSVVGCYKMSFMGCFEF